MLADIFAVDVLEPSEDLDGLATDMAATGFVQGTASIVGEVPCAKEAYIFMKY